MGPHRPATDVLLSSSYTRIRESASHVAASAQSISMMRQQVAETALRIEQTRWLLVCNPRQQPRQPPFSWWRAPKTAGAAESSAPR